MCMVWLGHLERVETPKGSWAMIWNMYPIVQCVGGLCALSHENQSGGGLCVGAGGT